MNKEDSKNIPRPPVVVVMGHIDHGKSTLLDYIRHTNTTEKEAGGITQHISAYEAVCEVGKEKRKITFLDTPGHEAFCSLRERGARVADIAVLVVAADDGVKPQTVEAIKCIAEDGIPFIVALNKIDKSGANADKTRQSLAENNVLVEGWGGTVPVVEISAKTGENIDALLELIALQSDIEDLKGDSSLEASGFVIESKLNPKQGIGATLIIKNGTLKNGMFVAVRGAYAKVLSIQDFKGKILSEASFSSPVGIVGWDKMPTVGAQFCSFKTKDAAVEFAAQNETGVEEQKSEPNDRAYLGLVIKADAYGSLEAVLHEINKLANEKIFAKIISKGIGAVNENDVKTAAIKKSLMIGFNVEIEKNAEALSMREKVETKNFKIIYELVDFVKERLKAATPISTIEVTIGNAKVLKTFSKIKDRQVLGGKVLEGEIKSGSLIKIFRRDSQIGEGKVRELQVQKIKSDSAKDGDEFGVLIESKTEIVPGDTLKITSLQKE